MQNEINNRESIHEAASEWLVLLTSGDANDLEKKRFESWLAEDPDHEHAYRLQMQAWEIIPELTHLTDLVSPASQKKLAWLPSAKGLIETTTRWLNQPVVPVAASVIILAGVLAFFTQQPLETSTAPVKTKAQFVTNVAEIKNLTLSDGSVVTLGARSEIDVRFSTDERRVILKTGEAFFSVAHNPERPFFVVIDDTMVRVVGTKFDVHQGVDKVRVSVLEGIVEVMSSEIKEQDISSNEAKLVVIAGQQVIAPRDSVDKPVLRSVEQKDLATWRDGRLVYVNAYLRDVIADISRYYDGKIEIASEELGDLQFTASFRSDQIGEMIDTLVMALPLEAEHVNSNHIIFRKKP